MSENNEYHLWRPSVVLVHNPDETNEYTGNVLIGLNLTRTEVVDIIRNASIEHVARVEETGDFWVDKIAGLFTPINMIAEAVATVNDGLSVILDDLFDAIDVDGSNFVLGSSRLGSGHLGENDSTLANTQGV